MSHNDDDRYDRKVFDCRSVNLTRIDKAIDLEIMVEECDYAIAGINRQIAAKFDGPQWEANAKRAISDIQHKRDLAAKKLAVVKEAKASAVQSTPETNFKSRFHKEAERLLPPAQFAQICEAARFVYDANLDPRAQATA